MHTDEHTVAYLRRFDEREDETLRAARARSEEADVSTVAAETGALLRFLARLIAARHVVEVGTGGGYSGLWLLGGIDPRGALTTIEADPDNQGLAQRAFADGGVSDRVRSMRGAALEVLPKLADGHYDLVFLDAVTTEYTDYLQHARRLLRPGGLLVADRVLGNGAVCDPSVSDEATAALRAFNDEVRDDPAFTATIVPVGDGVLAATYRPE